MSIPSKTSCLVLERSLFTITEDTTPVARSTFSIRLAELLWRPTGDPVVGRQRSSASRIENVDRATGVVSSVIVKSERSRTRQLVLDGIDISVRKIDHYLHRVLSRQHGNAVVLGFRVSQAARTKGAAGELAFHGVDCIGNRSDEAVADGHVYGRIGGEADHCDLVVAVVEVVYERRDRGRKRCRSAITSHRTRAIQYH